MRRQGFQGQKARSRHQVTAPTFVSHIKRCLAVFGTALLAGSAFGQGQVLFVNLDKTVTPQIQAMVVDARDGHPLAGTEARAALLGGPVETAIPSIVDRFQSVARRGNLSVLANPSDGSTWVNFRTGAAAGYVAASPRILKDVGYGQQAVLQMVVWTGDSPDWDSALAAAGRYPNYVLIGCSPAWTVTTTKSVFDTAFPSNMGLSAFSIQCILDEAFVVPRLFYSVQNGGLLLRWEDIPNLPTFTLQTSETLGPLANWTNAGVNPSQSDRWNYVFASLAGTKRFYRLSR